ncbi:MAG TPA: formate dehydrogenase accessory protein FdhE [Vicinamibacterales bacterium]|nr:formate dehydrogenase accessory protein FdhE [Vicinamibacterales bacterium]
MTAASALDDLKRQRQEWGPWLAVVETVLRETGAPVWDAAVPTVADPAAVTPDTAAAPHPPLPLLAGAAVALSASVVRRFFERLLGVASLGERSKMQTVRGVLDADVDVLALFTASLCQDGGPVHAAARASGADVEALQAVTALLSVPFLHACRRRFASSIRESWVQGYCPLCGAWPVFAEVRGIERSRVFRCGRCGGGWHARALCCPYCDMADHDELVRLQPENGDVAGASGAIDACSSCRGYVKTFTRLQGCDPGAVMLEDLASVALDIAALDQGYSRPSGAGHVLDVRVSDNAATRLFFAWKS